MFRVETILQTESGERKPRDIDGDVVRYGTNVEFKVILLSLCSFSSIKQLTMACFLYHRSFFLHSFHSFVLYLSTSPSTTSARFTYRLDRLMPRASKSRGSPAKVYNIFDLIVDYISHFPFPSISVRRRVLTRNVF